ncbi:MAG: SoxR reducing system RseC family protein [Betaproteobacteria bacterium]|nr:SoxR reducing system RseC family protein [Betaproteobacteria bacterium]
MLEARGIVVDTRGDYAIVETRERAGCGHCDTEGGCASGTLNKLFGSSPRRFRALNRAGAVRGDEVTVAVREGAVQRSAALMYLCPLAAMVAGALGGAMAGAGGEARDLHAAIGAGVGLLAGFLGIGFWGAPGRPDGVFHPVVTGRGPTRPIVYCKERQ